MTLIRRRIIPSFVPAVGQTPLLGTKFLSAIAFVLCTLFATFAIANKVKS